MYSLQQNKEVINQKFPTDPNKKFVINNYYGNVNNISPQENGELNRNPTEENMEGSLLEPPTENQENGELNGNPTEENMEGSPLEPPQKTKKMENRMKNQKWNPSTLTHLTKNITNMRTTIFTWTTKNIYKNVSTI